MSKRRVSSPAKKAYLDPNWVPDESVGSVLWWRWQLRDLLDRHGVRSNPVVSDEWIVEQLGKLITKSKHSRRKGNR